ncbi:MAG TPA: hypothetical protein PLP48_06545 [Acholeplasmataceae bacterium]|nr:hypothetical protein [Acholeplasmataceae bacterium]
MSLPESLSILETIAYYFKLLIKILGPVFIIILSLLTLYGVLTWMSRISKAWAKISQDPIMIGLFVVVTGALLYIWFSYISPVLNLLYLLHFGMVTL